MNIKSYYKKEIKKVASKLNKDACDIKFVAVADSHLDNSVSDTLKNISETDDLAPFDFMLHLGDFLNGNIPKEYTKILLKQQANIFSKAINGEFFPTPGNHDGYTDFSTNDMFIDEIWEECTGSKPYYFSDFGDFRIISINSFDYEFTADGKYKKIYKISDKQIEWLKKEALDTDKTIIFLSHASPLNSLTDMSVTPVIQAILEAKEEKGFEIAAWFIGHYHGDCILNAHGINFILVGSETAYVPQLWGFTDKEPEVYHERKLGSVSEDLWDAVTVNRKTRTIKLYRFGAGKDREVKY